MKCKTREEGLTAICLELKRGVKVRILKDTGGQRSRIQVVNDRKRGGSALKWQSKGSPLTGPFNTNNIL